MPLVGSLSEFPLPEVLLLIGSRTGRLRIYDVPELTDVDIDLSEGHAHGLHIGDYFLTEPNQIVAELSFMVESGEGLFEFSAQPIVSVRRDEPLPVSELVMLLVLHVDEKLAKQRALLAPQLFYILDKEHPESPPTPISTSSSSRAASFSPVASAPRTSPNTSASTWKLSVKASTPSTNSAWSSLSKPLTSRRSAK